MTKDLAVEVITALELFDHHIFRLFGALFTKRCFAKKAPNSRKTS